MSSITVALEALESDARLWEDASSTLGAAARSASGLALTSMTLSRVGEEVGLVSTCEEVRARVERLLREGETELQVIATTLRQIKTAYESQDAAQRSAFGGLWEPKP